MWSKLAVAVLLLTALERRCTNDQRPIEEAKASTFAESLGINTHLQYLETSYESFPRVKAALDFVGVRHLRDSAFRRGPQARERFAELASDGFSFNLSFNADISTQLALALRLEKGSPQAIASVEGPNEVNNDPVRFGGLTGVEAAQAYQAHLFRVVHSSPSLRGVEVLAYTNFPPSRGLADAVNVHSYAKGGHSPGPQLASDTNIAAAAQPAGQPFYITEFGYPTGVAGGDVVDEDTQAALIMVGWLDAFRAGARKVYLYELLDERPDSRRPYDAEQHYGLFDAYGRAKPAAVAIGTVLAYARQSAGAQPSTESLGVTVRGIGAKQLVLRRQDGSSLVAIWRETASASSPVTFNVALATPADVRRIDVKEGRTGPALRALGFDLAIGRAPEWLEIKPYGAGLVRTRPKPPSSRPSATSR